MDWTAMGVLASIVIAAFGGVGALVLWLHDKQTESTNQRFDRVDVRLDKIDGQIDDLKEGKVDATEMRREITEAKLADNADHRRLMHAVAHLARQVQILANQHPTR